MAEEVSTSMNTASIRAGKMRGINSFRFEVKDLIRQSADSPKGMDDMRAADTLIINERRANVNFRIINISAHDKE